MVRPVKHVSDDATQQRRVDAGERGLGTSDRCLMARSHS